MNVQYELKSIHICLQEPTAVSVSSELHVEWVMKSAIVGIFIPWKKIAINQRAFFS